MTGVTDTERGALLARHAEERADLGKEAEKARARIPRKERGRRARAAEDAAADVARLAARHAAELADAGFEAPGEADAGAAPGDGAAAPAGAPPPAEGRKESKAARRRRAKAEAEAEADRRVAEEKAGMGVSERARETAEIEAQLAPRGLAIRDIAPDGHCLYAAVADQLREAGGGGGVHDVASLRAAVADHMLAVRAEYMPFLETVECDDGKYDAYCRRLRSEAAWGGQVELQALARVLARRVEVFAAGMPLLVMGKGEAGGDGGGPPGTLRVSFHRSYYTLGNHYNSVVGGRNAPPAEAETPGAES